MPQLAPPDGWTPWRRRPLGRGVEVLAGLPGHLLLGVAVGALCVPVAMLRLLGERYPVALLVAPVLVALAVAVPARASRSLVPGVAVLLGYVAVVVLATTRGPGGDVLLADGVGTFSWRWFGEPVWVLWAGVAGGAAALLGVQARGRRRRTR